MLSRETIAILETPVSLAVGTYPLTARSLISDLLAPCTTIRGVLVSTGCSSSRQVVLIFPHVDDSLLVVSSFNEGGADGICYSLQTTPESTEPEKTSPPPDTAPPSTPLLSDGETCLSDNECDVSDELGFRSKDESNPFTIVYAHYDSLNGARISEPLDASALTCLPLT